jgi:DNA adenine methylase
MSKTRFDTEPSYTPPKIGALSPWFGSKRTLAPEIVRELGPHSKYDEPFCGSCAVLLAKQPATCETVNDLHGDLVNLARCLQEESTAVDLYARLSRLIMHETMFHEAALRWRARGHQPAGELLDLDRAADYMVCSWFGRNGVAGTSSYNQGFCVRYTKNGGHAAKRWQSAVESIPDWHWRLRNVTILNRDGFELLERLQDEKGCAIYVDPPYLVKGAKYVHDFAPADHERLAILLARFKRTRVVVSYYQGDLLNTLYAGWTKRRLKATKALVNQGARDKGGVVEAPEVLLMNGPSYGG